MAPLGGRVPPCSKRAASPLNPGESLEVARRRHPRHQIPRSGFVLRPTGDIHDRVARRAAPPESGRSGPVWPRGNDLRLKGLVTVARLAILGSGRSRMPEPHRPVLGSLAPIAIVIGAGAGVFAYTAGWFSPH